MLEKIKEPNLWNELQTSEKPIVMYGMGDGALKIFSVLDRYGLKVDAMFASDEFVRGHSFHGYQIHKYSDICAMYEEFNILMAFAVHDAPTLERIYRINQEHTVYAPDVPVAGDGLFTREYIQEHENEFDAAYELLSDARSRETFLDILNFKVSGKIEYLRHCSSYKEEVYRELLRPSDQETFVDLGAYDGDTIREFLDYVSDYRQIYALEPDSKNFKKLVKNTESLKKIQRFQMAAWNREEVLFFSRKAGRNSRLSPQGEAVPGISVDTLLKEPVTLLKMDIEGAESKAIQGAKRVIQTDHPKLYLCAYHRNEDLFQIPLQIHEITPDYRFYLRHHPYIPAWETNFYALPTGID